MRIAHQVSRFHSWIIAVLVLATWTTSVYAQGYPKESIRVIVPFAAGGNTDVTARIILAKVASQLDQSIVIENIGGAGGTIGSAAVARAKPDGYTLLYGNTSTLAIAPSVYSKLSYDPQKSFVAVAMVSKAANALFANPSLPVNSAAELVAYARANSGKMNYSSPGIGTPNQLAAELFIAKTGIKATHIPYRGGGDALSSVIAGTTQFSIDTLAVIGAPHAAGQVRALAIADSKRSPSFASLPTMAEAGVPEVEAVSFNGLLAPAGAPSDVISRLNTEINKALQDQEVLARFATLGIEPAPASANEFQAFIAKEIAKWESVAKSAGVRLD